MTNDGDGGGVDDDDDEESFITLLSSLFCDKLAVKIGSAVLLFKHREQDWGRGRFF